MSMTPIYILTKTCILFRHRLSSNALTYTTQNDSACKVTKKFRHLQIKSFDSFFRNIPKEQIFHPNIL